MNDICMIFFHRFHPDPHDPETGEENRYDDEAFDGMFRFEKQMELCEKGE